jgi:beta-glucanase (GH16 family)
MKWPLAFFLVFLAALSCHAQIKPRHTASDSPHICFSAQSLNFGKVKLGSSSMPEILTITNCGTGTWVPTWSDEFNGTAGTPPDPTKWAFVAVGQVQGDACLTNTNAVMDGLGNLVITAKQERLCGGAAYTTSRLMTHGTSNGLIQQYGRFEARIKLPYGKGMWPAWWGQAEWTGAPIWPVGGEIDILEERGSTPNQIQGAVHGGALTQGTPGYPGADNYTGTHYTKLYTLPSGNFQDSYHIFTVNWSPDRVDEYVDNTLYMIWTPADLSGGETWQHNYGPYYWELSNAVGGAFDGDPNGTTTFPQYMYIDYVKAYNWPPAALFMIGIPTSDSGQFVVTDGGVGGANPCVNAGIIPGGFCQVSIVFNPTGVGTRSASLILTDNVGTQTISLTGDSVGTEAVVAGKTYGAEVRRRF